MNTCNDNLTIARNKAHDDYTKNTDNIIKKINGMPK